MNESWREIELVDCTINGNISYGIVQPGQEDPNGIPIIRVNNFDNGSLETDSILKVSQSIEAKHLKTRLEGGEVLLTLVGSTGQTAIVPNKLKGWNVARAVAVIRVKPEIGAKWINLWLRSSKANQHLNSRANTTVQKTLNLKDVKSIPVSIPPENERKGIEHVIFSIENKIELNRQMNQTLEAMAQALFKSWFVDFDPVLDNALESGHEIPEALQAMAEKRQLVPDSKKLLHTNPALAAQFPSAFVFNEVLDKWVPDGWGYKDIGSLCKKIQNGGTPRRDTEEYWIEGNIPWLASGEVRQNFICETNSYITETGLANSSAKWIKKYSTVIAMYGATAGQVAITAMDLTTNQAVCSLIPIEQFEFFNYLNLSNQVGHLESQARGSAQQNISKGIIELLKVVVPNSKILNHFHENMKVNFEKHIANIGQIKTLTKLRDRLLPELISGRVRVSEGMIIH